MTNVISPWVLQFFPLYKDLSIHVNVLTDRYCQDLKEEIFYMIDRLPEGGEGYHGYDDGEGDD